MAEDLGSGVTRTLSALQRQFEIVVWQGGKPPLDSELNLMSQVDWERMRELVRSQMHSGFVIDPTHAKAEYDTDPAWSNFFKLAQQATDEEEPVLYANVNGWIVPVTGTEVLDGDTSNRINLSPPPASDSRIDLVFLEVWACNVAPNPSEANKPSASTVWKYGNVEFGGTNIIDDLEDPTIGYETTERVQVQYRLRVYGSGSGLGSSVALSEYPDGLGDPNILGQATATAPVTGFSFANMRETLGDPTLWRAGDGDPTNSLGTLDGYCYAVPICAIFRRNAAGFYAVQSAGNANQNGSFDRNPSAALMPDPREGAMVLSTATLTNDISASATGVVQVTNLTDSGIDDTQHTLSNLFLVIDDEIIGISNVSTATSPGTITIPTAGRGRNATMAVPHTAGATVSIYLSRPDGKYADEVHADDILDLRRAVTIGDWDYQRLLFHNLTKLVQGTLTSSYKQSAEGDTQGSKVVEVSYLAGSGVPAPLPNQVEPVDGPDGIRTVFSDSAALQTDVTVLCDQDAAQASGFVASFDATVDWDVGADFKPGGFMTSSSGFQDGSTIFLYIGGDSGNEGARATFRNGATRAVRFVTPKEYWLSDVEGNEEGKQNPVTLRFLSDTQTIGGVAPNEASRPGPVYPLRSENFERPFIVLGGILNTNSQIGGVEVYNIVPGPNGEWEARLPGLDFDSAGDWYTKDISGEFVNDPDALTNPILRGERTLYGMMTANGTDRTGESSEVYLLLFGDDTDAENNGCFKVVGAGAAAGYTDKDATAADRVRLIPLSTAFPDFASPGAAALAGELRSQTTNAEDGTGYAAGVAAMAICFTELQTSPWVGLTLPEDSKLAINLTLQYHPGRGATARVGEDLWQVAAVGAGSEYLRQAPGALDTTFPGAAGVPSNETYFTPAHVQVWNRLRGLGLNAPDIPNAGGQVVLSSEQDREAECFFDYGSKTLIFRPFLDRAMTLHSHTTTSLGPTPLVGPDDYPGPVPPLATPKDGAGIFTAGIETGYEVPNEYMPRFGRQDIPYHKDIADPLGSGTFLEGINHLFTDSTDDTEPQFYIIGGQDNTTGGNLVSSLYIQTGTTSGFDYGEYGTIIGPTTPAYQGRLVNLTNVVSSDLGRGMQGIELPPYLGIARLYGVYDRRDYIDKGGRTWQTDRVTPETNPATNLMRSDADKQTLFIRQGGAEDITGDADDHTYIVPSDGLDITLSPFYTPGEEFSDLEYVVVCVVFGFARGFINDNNFVLARRHTGAGAAISDGDVIELEGVRMTIPAPATLNQPVFAGYTRVVYQGDPYMTRAGTTRTVTDYEQRYGQVGNTSAIELATPIQQFDSNGDTIPEIPNARALQVLAAVDFYTTLGTGKIGGDLFPGTLLDAGYTNPAFHTRIPTSGTDPAVRVLARALSAGQRTNTSRASLSLEITDWSLIPAATTIRVLLIEGRWAQLDEGPAVPPAEWTAGVSNEATAQSIADAINGNANFARTVTATTGGTAVVTLTAIPVGAGGNTIFVNVSNIAGIRVALPQADDAFGPVTGGYLAGGVNIPANGGNGTSQLNLTGMTERLPLGILLQDSDFLCEDPLRTGASALATSPAGIQQVQTLLGLTEDSDTEYTRFLGGPGQWLGMADGGILTYAAYTDSTPTGSRKFRLYRGGGSAYVLTDPFPGGPVDWVSGSFQENLTPVLKGGVLVCKALLVRNFVEEAFSTNTEVTPGDEVQMVILTQGILGTLTTPQDGVELTGVISPTGFGEGYSAADRYRLEGKPMVRGKVRKPNDLDVNLALYLVD